MNSKALSQAVAYLRTSSAANVGADKDSERRQGEAVEAFARSNGYEIIERYYDASVSGADAVTARAGFSAMLERLLPNGVRTILVENASTRHPWHGKHRSHPRRRKAAPVATRWRRSGLANARTW